MGDLHVFTTDYEWVIAANLADAVEVFRETTGAEYDDPENEIEQLDDDARLPIWCDAAGNPGEINGAGCSLVTKTNREWCQRGRGYLSTTEQ